MMLKEIIVLLIVLFRNETITKFNGKSKLYKEDSSKNISEGSFNCTVKDHQLILVSESYGKKTNIKVSNISLPSFLQDIRTLSYLSGSCSITTDLALRNSDGVIFDQIKSTTFEGSIQVVNKTITLKSYYGLLILYDIRADLVKNEKTSKKLSSFLSMNAACMFIVCIIFQLF